MNLSKRNIITPLECPRVVYRPSNQTEAPGRNDDLRLLSSHQSRLLYLSFSSLVIFLLS